MAGMASPVDIHAAAPSDAARRLAAGRIVPSRTMRCAALVSLSGLRFAASV